MTLFGMLSYDVIINPVWVDEYEGNGFPLSRVSWMDSSPNHSSKDLLLDAFGRNGLTIPRYSVPIP